MRDRVLDKNNCFQPFPQKLESDAIRQGSKAAPADVGEPEPIIQSNAKAKAELLLKLNDDAKKQAEMDKVIKEREHRKALEEKLASELKKVEHFKKEKL